MIARVPFDEGTLTGTLTKTAAGRKATGATAISCRRTSTQSVDRAEALRPLVPAGMTMPELALRWILAEPAVSTIIPGMRKIKHVEANLAASDGQPLDASLLEQTEAHRWDRTPTDWSQ